jgi:hypothetical protein
MTNKDKVEKDHVLAEDRLYAEIALKHPDFKPKPISTEKRHATPLHNTMHASSLASSSPKLRKQSINLCDENDDDVISLENKIGHFDESSASLDQEELQRKKQHIQMRIIREAKPAEKKNIELTNGNEEMDLDHFDQDQEGSQEDEFGGQQLRAFTRKNGTIVFTKNGTIHKKKRVNKMESKLYDSEVVVNLYKDLDLDNFTEEEEKSDEFEDQPDEFVITLQKTPEREYQLISI